MRKCKFFKNMITAVVAFILVAVVAVAVPEDVNAAEKTIKGKGASSITITDAEDYYETYDYVWIKFTPSVNGYVTFKVSNASADFNYTAGSWMLCDAAKNQLSYTDYFDTSKDNAYDKSVTYGVKKKTTYYLKVTSYAGSKIDANIVKVNEKSGAKKAKAKTIKKNKAAQGVIAANSKETDWYKFKVTKKQYLKVFYMAKTHDRVKITFYEGKKSLGTVYPNYTSSKWNSSFVVNSFTKKKIKVNPGTFYVKVERYSANSSGMYAIKWK